MEPRTFRPSDLGIGAPTFSDVIHSGPEVTGRINSYIGNFIGEPTRTPYHTRHHANQENADIAAAETLFGATVGSHLRDRPPVNTRGASSQMIEIADTDPSQLRVWEDPYSLGRRRAPIGNVHRTHHFRIPEIVPGDVTIHPEAGDHSMGTYGTIRAGFIGPNTVIFHADQQAAAREAHRVHENYLAGEERKRAEQPLGRRQIIERRTYPIGPPVRELGTDRWLQRLHNDAVTRTLSDVVRQRYPDEFGMHVNRRRASRNIGDRLHVRKLGVQGGGPSKKRRT